jgi:hypothetical protein
MRSKRNNDLLIGLQKFKSIGIKLDDDDLDILEMFAQKETLTSAEVTRFTKSTRMEKEYKAVNSRVHKMRSLNLIEEAKLNKKGRHNEKYLRLTDDGIYQLFKNRVRGILVDQSSVMRGQTPVSNVGQFLKNYSSNLLFELFLYPYFEKQTISIDNFDLVEKLFRYLNECCMRVDIIMRLGRVTPILIQQFSWNNIPGEDEAALLASLRDIFALQEWDKETVNIRKIANNRTIIVTTPNIRIEVELDLPQSKAISTQIDHNKVVQTHEYRIVKLASRIVICTIEPSSESLKNALESGRLLESIDSPFYDLVARMRYDHTENSTVLAQDTKFMTHLEDLHENFESGYRYLIQLRKKLR